VQITREDQPDRQVALLIEFAPDEIEPALNKTYQRLVNKVNIPGFRPGKAPRRMFEQFVGREALIQEATETLLAGAIKEALERENLHGAEVSDAKVETTDPLVVRVIFDQEPLVEVPDYSDIRVERDAVEVSADEVEKIIDRARRNAAEWQTPEDPRPARMGDRVTVDLETFTIDGPVPEMTGTGVVLELSEQTGPAWPREIDESLVGMQIDEEKDFAITFPEGYTDEKMRGRDATVHVKVTAMEEPILPELDDAFAEKVGQVPTVADLRQRIEENMRSEAEHTARGKQARAVLDQILERSNVEVSNAMINHDIEHRYQRLADELQKRRITPARYFTYEGLTEKIWREAQREPARIALKELLVLREFTEREGLSVSDAEVEAELARVMEEYKDNPNFEQLRGMFDTPEQREQISNRLFDRKLSERLIAIAEGTAGAAADAATPAPGTGAVPATEQEPGALETAGGAAEVLGIGAEAESEAAKQTDETGNS
jgi:trigger factor